MQGKTAWIVYLCCLWLAVAGCENDSGGSSSPVVTKYQDAQIDGNTVISDEVRADSPKVGVAGSGRATSILVAWLDHRLGDRNVFFNYRTPAGSWAHASDLQVDTGLGKGMFANELDMAYSQDGSIIHIVWADQREGQETVWYNVSRDGGQSFQAKAVPISPNWPFNAKSTEPHICCSNNGQIVYVAWRYGIADVAMRFSRDAGATWSDYSPDNDADNFFAQAPPTVTENTYGRGTWVAKDISIDCGDDGRYCHLAWQGGWDYVLYRCWDSSSDAWQPAAREAIASDELNYIRRVQLKCNGAGDKAYLAYRERYFVGQTGFSRIALATTSDFGDTFVRKDVSLYPPFLPALYCDRASGDVCVVWEDFDPDAAPSAIWRVMARHCTNDASWDGIQTLSAPGNKNNRPFLFQQVAGNANHVYVVWADFSDFAKPRIFYNHSQDWGKTWDNSTGTEVSSPGSQFVDRLYQPVIAVNGENTVYAGWSEKRNRATPQVFGAAILPPLRAEETIPHHTAVRQHAWSPKISANGKHVYGIWLSDRFGGQDVFFSRSQDYGTNWVEDFLVNEGQGELCKNLQLFCDTSNFVYLGWEKVEPAETENIQGGHVRGEPIGRAVFQRFQFAQRQSENQNYEATGNPQALLGTREACDRGRLAGKIESLRQAAGISKVPRRANDRSVVVSRDLTSIESRFFGDDSGILYFIANVKEDTLADTSGQPNQFNSLLRASQDRGNTWNVGGFWGYGDYKESFLRIDGKAVGDKLYVVYEVRGGYPDSGTHSGVHFIRWYDYGESLDFFSELDDDASGDYDSRQPKLCKNQDRLLVAWTEFRDGVNPDIYFNYSPSEGSDGSWQGAQPLDTSASDEFAYGRARLACGPDVFYSVWSQHDATNDRFGVVFNAIDIDASGDITMRQALRLDSGTASAGAPEIASEGDNVYVIWQDTRLGGSDIVARFSTDRGRTWSSEALLNTNSPGYAIEPVGATGGNYVYGMWADYRDGKNIRFEARQR